MRTHRCWLCLLASSAVLLSLLGILSGAEPVMHDDYLVYVGTYTRGSDSRGIYRLRLDARTGEMTEVQVAAEAVNPSFLAVHPKSTALYAVSEIDDRDGRRTGGVAAWKIDQRTGDLTPLNAQSSGGTNPCYVTTDAAGRFVLVANYSSGSIASLPIAGDGRLDSPSSVIQHAGQGTDPRRQEGPHAHSILLGPDGTRAYVPDLGLDKVLIYQVDSSNGALTANDPAFATVAPAAGPRHIDFHPNGRFAYVINEMGSTITAFRHNSQTGALEELQTVPSLPEGEFPGNSTADIHVHPNGRFLYGSNRGHDSIVVYAIDAESGRLTYVQHQSTLGETPRNFGIDPSGRILLAENQKSGTIFSFRIDADTGRLTPTGHQVDIPRPVCVRFVHWPLQKVVGQ